MFIRLKGARYRAIRTLVGLNFLLLVVLSIIFPQLWQDFADLVGVGRGVDLLLYMTIVAFITFSIASVRKIRDMDRRIAILVMEIAADPVPSDSQSPDKDE